MLRFLLSIKEEELGDNVADIIACSTDENWLWTPSSNPTPACSETEFEALSNLTRPRFSWKMAVKTRVCVTYHISASGGVFEL